MSPMLFADAIMHGKTLKVFNNGDMGRDFTYVEDIIEGVRLVISTPAKGVYGMSSPLGMTSLQGTEGVQCELDPSWSTAPYRVYNIGSSSPVRLMDYIETLEEALGKRAEKEFLPMQPGDVLNTYCDVSGLESDFGYRPRTSLKEGLAAFAEWYKEWDAKIN